MWHSQRFAQVGAEFHALELTAERAGCAWGCPFASSDEYEAATIQARRDAGFYAPKRQRRHVLLLAALATAVLAFSLALAAA